MEIERSVRSLTTESFYGERRGGEIQKQAVLKIRRLQIAATDGKMDVFQRLDSLEFDDDSIFDKKVEAVLAYLMVLVKDCNGFLTNELNPTEREFHGERFLIKAFKKSGTKIAMNTNRCGYDAVRDLRIP